jgi:hypothetical protein
MDSVKSMLLRFCFGSFFEGGKRWVLLSFPMTTLIDIME